MLGGETCTWYQKEADPDTRGHHWKRYVLEDANWQEDRVIRVASGSFESADIIMIYIPLDSLPEGKKIQPEDCFVRGVSETEKPPPNHVMVTNVAVYERCSVATRHVEVTCKI